MNIIGKIGAYLKKEIVLTVSLILAVVSAFLIRPDAQYISYIDYRTLGILLSLMLVMAGLKSLGIFRQIGEMLVSRVSSVRGVVLVLVALCFFSAMLITNDVSLITFVPFTVITLGIAGKKELYIPVIVLETMAANLGSMATPIGNPQNLYLFSMSGLGLGAFVRLILPYTLCSAVLLLAAILLQIRNTPLQLSGRSEFTRSGAEKRLIALYLLCFAVSLVVVARVLDCRIGLAAVLVLILIFDRKRIKEADYGLLLTFIFLFIFIGNMKRIPAVSELLGRLVKGQEVPVSILLSQVISNVPAAILCSGFTDNIPALILGTNLGGLGTLIASMASLISFKQFSSIEGADRKRFIGQFTVWNLLFLAILVLLYLLIGR